MFILERRGGTPVKIDHDELQKALDGMAEGKDRAIVFRQGIVISGSIIGIVEDRQRKIEFLEKCKRTPPFIIRDWRKERLPNIFDQSENISISNRDSKMIETSNSM